MQWNIEITLTIKYLQMKQMPSMSKTFLFHQNISNNTENFR